MPDTVDDFDTFFDQLSALKPDETPPASFGTAPVVAPVETPAVVAPETPVVADPPATDMPTGEAPVTGDGGVPVVETPVAPIVAPVVAPVAPVQGDSTAMLERLADLLDKRQPAPVAPQQQTQQPQPIYTASEAAELEKFQQDWPDIFKAFSLLARGSTVQNNAYVFSEVARAIAPQLQNMQTVQVEHQYDGLRRAIPDYDTVRDPVIEWVQKDRNIPAYLRTAYDGVIKNGDVGEITDLVNRWREATGVKAPRQAPVKSANELSDAAKQAAASLAPVVSKRATTAQAEPTGFDDAFEVFAKA